VWSVHAGPNQPPAFGLFQHHMHHPIRPLPQATNQQKSNNYKLGPVCVCYEAPWITRLAPLLA
jgi:hypothetical protein